MSAFNSSIVFLSILISFSLESLLVLNISCSENSVLEPNLAQQECIPPY